ncbi:MAG: hypothetical protein ACKPCM_01000 [Pseudanabaena sp.]
MVNYLDQALAIANKPPAYLLFGFQPQPFDFQPQSSQLRLESNYSGHTIAAIDHWFPDTGL